MTYNATPRRANALRRALRASSAARQGVAALALLGVELGGAIAEAAALLDDELAAATARERRNEERAAAVASVLRAAWPEAASMNRRACLLARDLQIARRATKPRRSTQYEIALEINRLFEKAPSARTLLRIAQRASD
jgi:hypothetical protein